MYTCRAYAVEPALCRTVGPRESQPRLPVACTILCSAGLLPGLLDWTASVSAPRRATARMPSFAVIMFVFLWFGGLLCAVRGDSVSSQFTMTDAQIETTAASIFHVSVSGPVPVSRLATVCYRVYICCLSFCDIQALSSIAVMSEPDSGHVTKDCQDFRAD